MPSPSVMTAMRAKPEERRSDRMAKRDVSEDVDRLDQHVASIAGQLAFLNGVFDRHADVAPGCSAEVDALHREGVVCPLPGRAVPRSNGAGPASLRSDWRGIR